ncbi:hypothetical protein Hypma_004932 [Hypsizygus marmoreus]|uniref:CxC2-like cysteine cluster KDZ transposase-associated domain-containing protein n=1 Tax=Hypsizygus marmoreus TaxID=39966 RepID=A0A369K8G8_HYPMA|nr:hypothetical protein Hypma_004932 [Hypsizygus marmoreus]
MEKPWYKTTFFPGSLGRWAISSRSHANNDSHPPPEQDLDNNPFIHHEPDHEPSEQPPAQLTIHGVAERDKVSQRPITAGYRESREPGRNLDIVLVKADTLERTSIHICLCRPAARQMLDRGFFPSAPSAPLAPTLAVDLKVLDFVSSLYTTKDSLRKRFSNALLWYNALQDATTRHVDTILQHPRIRIQFDLNDGIKVSTQT